MKSEKSFSVHTKFWAAWLPLSAIGLAIIYIAFFLLHQVQVQKTDEQVTSSFRLAKNYFQEDFEIALADLQFIMDNPIISNFINNSSDYNKKMVVDLFLGLSASHKRYDQMRLLSSTGIELIRVDFNQGLPISLAKNSVQDKSDRYYFKQSLPLAKGEIFISQFDLNMENGVIEKPIKPTIRFSAPLFDKEKNRAGVVVLNYIGDKLLTHMQDSFKGLSGHVMLLNSDGYWLQSNRDYREWGFMYGLEESFGKLYTEDWRKILNSDEGVFESDLWRVNYATMPPPIPPVNSQAEHQLKTWKLVVVNDDHHHDVEFFKKHLAYLFPLLIAYPLGSILLWYWAKAAVGRNRAEEELVELNLLLEEKVQTRTHELEVTREATIMSLATLAETRDNETGQHLRRTQRYAKVLAKQLGSHTDFEGVLTDEAVEQIYRSAPLHDIGKVGIPDYILHKPGALDDEEFEIMKTHTTIGSNALDEAIITINTGMSESEALTFLNCARDIAHYHHERWDGNGYPAGLCGEEIPLTARIMALADVYDALVSKRIYKVAFSRSKAEDIIFNESKGQFDPRIIEAFKSVSDEFWEIRKKFTDP